MARMNVWNETARKLTKKRQKNNYSKSKNNEKITQIQQEYKAHPTAQYKMSFGQFKNLRLKGKTIY